MNISSIYSSRFFRFFIVGVVNTAVNFLSLNILAFILGFSPWLANIIATCIAMAASFVLNNLYVFNEADKYSLKKRFALFIGVTAACQLVINQIIFIAGIDLLRKPVESMIDSHFTQISADFYVINTAKIISVLGTMGITYYLYNQLVFISERVSSAD